MTDRPIIDAYDTDQPFWDEDDDIGPMTVVAYAVVSTGLLLVGGAVLFGVMHG